MSSNDYILIEETKVGYKISHRDADTGYAYEYLNPVKTLEEAVKEAQKLIEEKEEDGEPVEYGLKIKLSEKKMLSLVTTLKSYNRLMDNSVTLRFDTLNEMKSQDIAEIEGVGIYKQFYDDLMFGKEISFK